MKESKPTKAVIYCPRVERKAKDARRRPQEPRNPLPRVRADAWV